METSKTEANGSDKSNAEDINVKAVTKVSKQKTDFCEPTTNRRSLLRFKCREFLLKEDKIELIKTLKQRPLNVKKRKKRRVKFADVMKAKFISLETPVSDFEPIESLDTLYLLTGHNMASLVKKFAEIEDISMLFSPENSLNHWRTSGMTLLKKEYINSPLDNTAKLLTYSDQPRKSKSERVKDKRTADLKGFATTVGCISHLLGFHNFNDLSKNTRLVNALTDYSSGVNAVVTALLYKKRGKLSSGLTSKDTDTLATEGPMQPTDSSIDDEMKGIVQLLCRFMFLNETLMIMGKGFVKKKMKSLLASKMMSTKASSRDFEKALSYYHGILRCFNEIGAYFGECEEVLKTNAAVYAKYNSVRVKTSQRRDHFARILVDLGKNKFQDIFSGSVLVKQAEGHFKITHLRGFKNAEDSDTPDVDKFYPEPELILPPAFESFTLVLKDARSFWLSLKQTFVELYMRSLNSGIITAVVNNNFRLLKTFERITIPPFIREESRQLSENPSRSGKWETQEYKIKSLFKVFKKGKKKPLALSMFSVLLNPIVRADLQFSFSDKNCPLTCKGHRNMLLGLALRQGNVAMAKYLASKGLSFHSTVCSQTRTKQLSWEYKNNVGKAQAQKPKVTQKEARKRVTRDKDKQRDAIGMLNDLQLRVQSINHQQPVLSMAVEFISNENFIKQRKYSQTESDKVIGKLNDQYKFLASCFRSKKVKVLSHNAHLLKSCVPFLSCFSKTLRRFQKSEQKAYFNFHSLERQAVVALKAAAKTSNYKEQVRLTVALLNLKLFNLIIKKAKRETRGKDFTSLVLLLIDECVKQDKFHVISFLTSNVVEARKSVSWLVRQISAHNSSNRRILKGIVVLREEYGFTLSQPCLAHLLNSSKLRSIGFANLTLKAGELHYLKKLFQLEEVQAALFERSDLIKQKAIVLMGMNAIQPEYVQNLLQTLPENKQREVEKDATFLQIVINEECPPPEATALFSQDVVKGVFKNLVSQLELDNDSYRYLPALLYLLKLENSCVSMLKPFLVCKFLSFLFEWGCGEALEGVVGDLTAYKLYFTFIELYVGAGYKEKVYMEALLLVLERLSEESDAFLALDFIHRMRHQAKGAEVSLSDRKGGLNKEAKKLCKRLNMTIEWHPKEETLIERRLRQPLALRDFIKTGV